MSDGTGSAARVPRRVSLFSPILKFLLAAGVPMGFNGLVTIRGRKSGLPRTTPVAIIAVSGRRYVWAPWGEVHWVRNLRAAGRATITVRRRKEEVSATELDPTQRVGFFRDVLGPLARGIPFGVSYRRWGRSRPSVRGGRRSTCLRTPPTSMKSAAEARDRASRADSRTPPRWRTTPASVPSIGSSTSRSTRTATPRASMVVLWR
jgi:deazaflavin-dependent oxidoreductase (nitroreductase family)